MNTLHASFVSTQTPSTLEALRDRTASASPYQVRTCLTVISQLVLFAECFLVGHIHPCREGSSVDEHLDVHHDVQRVVYSVL